MNTREARKHTAARDRRDRTCKRQVPVHLQLVEDDFVGGEIDVQLRVPKRVIRSGLRWSLGEPARHPIQGEKDEHI